MTGRPTPSKCGDLSIRPIQRFREATPSGPDLLALLAMLRMLPTALAVLPQRDPTRVVPSVLLGRIVSLFTLRAGQRNDNTIRSLGHG